ncbi:uncharacterized protein LOC144114973 [Amblyomma americanum]
MPFGAFKGFGRQLLATCDSDASWTRIHSHISFTVAASTSPNAISVVPSSEPISTERISSSVSSIHYQDDRSAAPGSVTKTTKLAVAREQKGRAIVERVQQPTSHDAEFSGPRHLFPVPGYWLKIVPTSLHLGL